MALDVTRSPRARLDLIEVWHYIAEDNEAAASAMLRRVDQVTRMLSERPHAGRSRKELNPEIRSFPVGNYVVFYRVTDRAIDIVRVLSSFRDIDRDYFDETP